MNWDIVKGSHRGVTSWMPGMLYPRIFLRGRLRNMTKNLNQNNRYSGRDLKKRPLEYETANILAESFDNYAGIVLL